MTTDKENIINILRESADLKLQMIDQVDLVWRIAQTLEKCLRSGNKVILFGIGISTSGKSPNVIEALQAAKAKGAITIGFCGQNNQQMASVTDMCLAVPSEDTARIQEIHMVIGHIVCYLVEQALFGISM